MSLYNFIKSLRRVTSKGEFIPEIDGLRFLAIVPVVIMHAHTNYNRVFEDGLQISPNNLYSHFVNEGGKGVWIFFAISGFILSYFFAKHFYVNNRTFKELSLKTYFIRRITRLEPPFLISMTVLFFFTSFAIAHNFTTLLPNFFASITYSHNLFFGKWSTINPVTWSLEVEIQFYIIAPFLSAFFFVLKENLRNFLLVFLIIVIPFIVLDANSPFITNTHLRRTIPVYIQYFLVGILFASLYTGKFWRKIRDKSYVWDFITLVSIVGSFYMQTSLRNLFFFDSFLLLIMIGAFKGNIFNRIFSNSIVATLGGMCYSIYLIHYAVAFGVSKILNRIVFDSTTVNYVFHMGVTIIIITASSIVFYKYFEKPFMDKYWPEKFSKWFFGLFSNSPKSI